MWIATCEYKSSNGKTLLFCILGSWFRVAFKCRLYFWKDFDFRFISLSSIQYQNNLITFIFLRDTGHYQRTLCLETSFFFAKIITAPIYIKHRKWFNETDWVDSTQKVMIRNGFCSRNSMFNTRYTHPKHPFSNMNSFKDRIIRSIWEKLQWFLNFELRQCYNSPNVTTKQRMHHKKFAFTIYNADCGILEMNGKCIMLMISIFCTNILFENVLISKLSYAFYFLKPFSNVIWMEIIRIPNSYRNGR